MLRRIAGSVAAHPFAWTMALVATLFYVAENTNSRFQMSDLVVGYTAAERMLAHQPFYGQPFGLTSGVFKYAPVVLFPLIPLALLPYSVAKTAHFFVTAALIVYVTILVERVLVTNLFTGLRGGRNSVRFLSCLVVAVHFGRELHLGNYNVMLLGAVVLGLDAILHQREIRAGILVGLSILLKPHFLVLLPLLLLRRNVRALASATACMLAGFVAPAVVFGWANNLDLHVTWLRAVVAHNENVDWGVNTLPSLLYRTLGLSLGAVTGTVYAIGVVLVVAGLVLLLVVYDRTREGRAVDSRTREAQATLDFVFEYLLVVALVPSIVVTDTEHFLWSLPIVMFVLTHLVRERQKRDALLYWAIGCLVLYGGNWYELWGPTLSIWIEKAGILGVGNILLLLTAVYMFSRQNRRLSVGVPSDAPAS